MIMKHYACEAHLVQWGAQCLQPAGILVLAAMQLKAMRGAPHLVPHWRHVRERASRGLRDVIPPPVPGRTAGYQRHLLHWAVKVLCVPHGRAAHISELNLTQEEQKAKRRASARHSIKSYVCTVCRKFEQRAAVLTRASRSPTLGEHFRGRWYRRRLACWSKRVCLLGRRCRLCLVVQGLHKRILCSHLDCLQQCVRQILQQEACKSHMCRLRSSKPAAVAGESVL